jgi:heme exporter protein B
MSWRALLVRELRISLRVGGGALLGVLFFLSIVVAVPFAIGPDLNTLARISPAILWIGALLSSLLNLDRLFQQDKDTGALDLLILSGRSLEGLVLVKCLAHWLATILPLVIAAPLLAFLLNLPPELFGAVVVSLLVGTPALTLMGAIGASLAVALRRGGLLSVVLILPLSLPVLIFAISTTRAAVDVGMNFWTPFLILCALVLVALAIAPIAAAALLRLAVD